METVELDHPFLVGVHYHTDFLSRPIKSSSPYLASSDLSQEAPVLPAERLSALTQGHLECRSGNSSSD